MSGKKVLKKESINSYRDFKIAEKLKKHLIFISLGILGFCLLLPMTSFCMWKGIAPVVQPDGSIKYVDKPVPDWLGHPTIPKEAVGRWGFEDETIGFKMPPVKDTTNWTAKDYMEYRKDLIGQVSPPLKDWKANANFYLIDKGGGIRERLLDQWRKPFYGRDGVRYKQQLMVNYPPDIKGLSILTITHSDQNQADDVWLFLPALRKVRRLAPAQKMDSLMGTDVTIDEFDKDSRLWDYEFFKKEDTIDVNKPPFKDAYGMKESVRKNHRAVCVIIKAIPRVKDWPIGYQLMWLDKKKGLAKYQETFDKAGKKIKIETPFFEHIVPGYPTVISFGTHYAEDLKTGHRTYLTPENRDEKGNPNIDFKTGNWSNYVYWVDTGYSDEIFSHRFMERGTR